MQSCQKFGNKYLSHFQSDQTSAKSHQEIDLNILPQWFQCNAIIIMVDSMARHDLNTCGWVDHKINMTLFSNLAVSIHEELLLTVPIHTEFSVCLLIKWLSIICIVAFIGPSWIVVSFFSIPFGCRVIMQSLSGNFRGNNSIFSVWELKLISLFEVFVWLVI